MKTIRETCNKNVRESKWKIKMCLNFLAFSLNDFIFKMDYSRKKKKERDGSGYLISRSIEEIEIGISRGDQEKILWNL